jgi:hypothetical protein
VNGNSATAPAGPGTPPIAAGGVVNGCNAILNSTQVNGNTAISTSGAGIVNHGTMTMNKSQVNGNTAAGKGVAASGGGILNANIGSITNAPISGVLTINNSQVNNNTAGSDGGGIANGFGSAMMGLPGGSVTMNPVRSWATRLATAAASSTTEEQSPWQRPPSAATTQTTASRQRPSLDAPAESSSSGLDQGFSDERGGSFH